MNNGFWNVSESISFWKNDAAACRLTFVYALAN